MRDIFSYVVVIFILVCALALDYAESVDSGDIATVAVIGICLATISWAVYNLVGALRNGGIENE